LPAMRGNSNRRSATCYTLLNGVLRWLAKGVEVVRRQYTWDALTEQFLRRVDTARDQKSAANAES